MPKPMLAFVMLICMPFSFLIAHWAHSHKKIGFWWACFFCLTLTPVIGFIFAQLSGDRNEKNNDSLFRDYLLFMLSGIAVPVASLLFVKGFIEPGTLGSICLLAGTGVMGMCFYFLKLAIIMPRDSS